MSPNILLQIEQWICDAGILDDKTLKQLILFLDTNNYKKGMFIHPGTLMRKINLSTEKTYDTLNLLTEKGIIQENYELYCHECEKYNPKLYQYYNDIPRSSECEGCFQELTRDKNVIVIYKVMVDGE